MPFDPRPHSKGGNWGIDEIFSRKPDGKKFRVIGVDTFDGGDWVYGDYDLTIAEIRKKHPGGEMLKVHVYDQNGKHVAGWGRF